MGIIYLTFGIYFALVCTMYFVISLTSPKIKYLLLTIVYLLLSYFATLKGLSIIG